MIPEKWFLVHTDAYHTGTRETCSHCQEMIRIYGEMPAVDDILQAETEYWRRERAEKRGYQKAPIPEALRWQVFERDAFTCVKCGSRRMLRADHIYPERLGGETTLSNLQTLCHICNSRKGMSIPLPTEPDAA